MCIKNYFGCLITIFVLLLNSCNKNISENSKSMSGEYRLFFEAIIKDTAKINSKVFYSNINDTAKFFWEKSSDLIVAVTDNNKTFSSWNSNTNYYAVSDIVPNKNDRKEAKISSNVSLKEISTIKTDNNVFCFTPYNSGNSNVELSCTEKKIEVLLNMPQTFSQSAFNKLEELSAFTYLYANSKIAAISASEKSVIAMGTTFSTIPAIIQFKITNSLNTNVNVKSVTMRILNDDNSTVNTPNKLILTAEAGKNAIISEPNDKTKYYNSISAELTTATKIAKNESESLFAYILPSSANLSDKVFEFTVITDDGKKYTVKKDNVNLNINSGKDQFLYGYKYIFNINLEKNDSVINYEELYLDKNPDKNNFKTRALGIYFTAVSCYYCPPVEARINNILTTPIKDSVVFVTMFESSTFSHTDASALFKLFSTGTPSINLDLDIHKRKINFYTEDEIKNEIRSNYSRNTQKNRIGIAATVTANEKDDITVDVVIKSATTRSDLGLGIWLVEDGLYDRYRNINHDRGYVAGNVIYPLGRGIVSFLGSDISEIKKNGYVKQSVTILKNGNNKLSNIRKGRVIIYVTGIYDSYDTKRVINAIQCNIGETKYFEYN